MLKLLIRSNWCHRSSTRCVVLLRLPCLSVRSSAQLTFNTYQIERPPKTKGPETKLFDCCETFHSAFGRSTLSFSLAHQQKSPLKVHLLVAANNPQIIWQLIWAADIDAMHSVKAMVPIILIVAACSLLQKKATIPDALGIIQSRMNRGTCFSTPSLK